MLVSLHLDYIQPIQQSSKQYNQNLAVNRLNYVKHKSNKLSTHEYKGMTLKQYFRLSQFQAYNLSKQIKQTEEQNVCSSQQATTPYFNQCNGRHKIKTQVYEDKNYLQEKLQLGKKQKKQQIFHFENITKNLKVEKLPKELRPKKDKITTKSKRANTLAANKDHLNRSTITSFYQIEQKKKKMLDKMKYQKQRINQLKLSDAFFITKYADKFKIDPQQGY